MAPWRLENLIATLEWSGLKGQIDLSTPANGISALFLHGQPCDGNQLLGAAFLSNSADVSGCDAYVRGPDLVATYAETPERPFRVQVYWRCVSAPVETEVAAVAIDLEISVQTPLLDCLPQVSTRSVVRSLSELRPLQVTSDGARQAGPSGALSRGGFALQLAMNVGEQTWQYAEMIHAEDARGGNAEHVDGAWQIQQELFEPGLEKGVIRRVRVRGLLYAGEPDHALVQQAYERFHGAVLPLTV